QYSSFPRSGFLFKDSCLEPLVLGMLASKGLHALHASSLLIGKKAWVFCGAPGAGKTVLGLIGVRQGFELLSDDITLLRGDEVFPYPVPARLSPTETLDAHVLLNLVSSTTSADFVVRS